MKKSKCVHVYGRDGFCQKCKSRKPGRPKKTAKPAAAKATAPKIAAVVQPPPPVPVALRDPTRADRFAQLFAPAAPAPLEPEEPEELEAEEPEPEPEKSATTTIEYGWEWIGQRFADGVDIVGSLAIDRLSDREPLDADPDAEAQVAKVAAKYGEQKLGRVEVPTWLVLIIMVCLMVWSKYAGAPEKPKKIEPAKPEKPADAADTKIPESAPAAANPEESPPLPTVVSTGNVGTAVNGF